MIEMDKFVVKTSDKDVDDLIFGDEEPVVSER